MYKFCHTPFTVIQGLNTKFTLIFLCLNWIIVFPFNFLFKPANTIRMKYIIRKLNKLCIHLISFKPKKNKYLVRTVENHQFLTIFPHFWYLSPSKPGSDETWNHCYRKNKNTVYKFVATSCIMFIRIDSN